MKLLLRFAAVAVALAWPALLGCSSVTVVKGNIYKASSLPLTATFAVLPFTSASEGKTMTSRVSTDGNAISDILSIQMLYKGFKVLERDKLDKILKEAAIAQSGAEADADSTAAGQAANAVDIGKLLGVKYVVCGSVIQYEYQYASGAWRLALGVSARIIDVETSKIILIATASRQGDNIADVLNDISIALTDAIQEEKVYVWQ